MKERNLKGDIESNLSKLPVDKLIEVADFVEFLTLKGDDAFTKSNEPLRDCFAGLVPDDIENDIRKLRKESTKKLDEKFKNWNT